MTTPVGERPHMPDYGVDTEEWEPLPWAWAAQRLSANRNFWLVTVSARGRPHALPVWGVWDDDDHRLAFSCGPRSRKAANLAANPYASVTTEGAVEAISMEGRAVSVHGDQRERWIQRYLAKYQGQSPDLSAEFLRQNMVFEFAPHRAFAIIEREHEFATRATRWRFA